MSSIFSKSIFTDRRFVISLWFMVVCVGLISPLLRGIPNNYQVFKYVFYHTIDQVNLYGLYPEYHDSNYYGPLFSLIIAPFAVLPDQLGFVLLGLFTSSCLFVAIYKLPISWKWKAIIFYITLNDLYITTLACQTNTLVAGLIIGSFVLIKKEKELWAAALIVLGFYLKIYGIVGLAFFFFSRQKIKFITWFVVWSVILFFLPVFISSFQFLLKSYSGWFNALLLKDGANAGSLLQDYSVMGITRRISGNRDLSSLIILIPAAFTFALQYIRTDLYKNQRFQFTMLALVLISIVIFSSGSESPTYIIAMTGIGVWFATQFESCSRYAVFLLIFVFVFSSFATTDFIPHVIRTFIKTYALKAFPCFLVWLTLIYQQLKGYGMKVRSDGSLSG